MFSPSRFSSRIVVVDPTEPDLQHGWDSVLHDLATEPGMDFLPMRAQAVSPVTIDRKAPSGFGGLLDLLLIAAAVTTAVVVSAVALAVFLA